MARAKKVVDIGHNTQLTDDERAALKAYYAQQALAQERVVAEAALVASNARKALNGVFMKARGDIGILRQDFEDDIRLMKLPQAAYVAHEKARDQRHKDSGLKTGEQIELQLGDTADDKASAMADGKRAGLRGDDGICPDHIAPILRADWEHGWADGQAELGAKLGLAETVLAKIKASQPAPAEAEVVGDDEPEQEDLEEAIDAAARKLRRKGFTNTAPATVGDEAPADDAVIDKAA